MIGPRVIGSIRSVQAFQSIFNDDTVEHLCQNKLTWSMIDVNHFNHTHGISLKRQARLTSVCRYPLIIRMC